MIRVLLVDNYDSFTFNLAQAMSALGADVTVLRADDPSLDAALDARPERVVISPGPGRPEAAGRSPQLVRAAPERGIPTLGVCLGLQCAAVAFGAAVVRAPEPRHGKTSAVHHDGLGVFAGIPDPTIATRAPADAATIAATVEMLKVPERSPPVPHVSIAPAGSVTRTAALRSAPANPAISSTVSPRIASAASRAASCAGVASPAMTLPIALSASARVSVRPAATMPSAPLASIALTRSSR